MTVQDLIDDVLTDLAIVSAGGTPSSSDRTFGLRVVNQTIAEWGAQGIPIPKVSRSTVALTNATSYTLSTAPMRIRGASVTAYGIRTPVTPATAEQWASGAGTDANPALLYDGDGTTPTIRLNPNPTGGTLELWTIERLATLALTDSIAYKDEYTYAVRRALAVNMALAFGIEPTQAMLGLATDAKQSIIAMNQALIGPPPSPGVPAQ